ncbi:hypothetical protein [Roseovarius sp.]|uniref:hypothetical protein n=1 Tax=Roseovarius sp. TaxID=1486281 RepID=UPI003A9756D3
MLRVTQGLHSVTVLATTAFRAPDNLQKSEIKRRKSSTQGNESINIDGKFMTVVAGRIDADTRVLGLSESHLMVHIQFPKARRKSLRPMPVTKGDWQTYMSGDMATSSMKRARSRRDIE